MKEMDLLRSILGLSTGAVRLFRNNTGTFWAGRVERVNRAGAVLVQPGDVVIRGARPVDCGLCPGSADLIGWTQVQVTPDMVGRRLAVFTGVEVKAETGRLSPLQARFLQVVRDMGGLAGVARSTEEAQAIIAGGYREDDSVQKK